MKRKIQDVDSEDGDFSIHPRIRVRILPSLRGVMGSLKRLNWTARGEGSLVDVECAYASGQYAYLHDGVIPSEDRCLIRSA